MKKQLTLNCYLIFLYTLLAFPLFYFVYKYSTPYLGLMDFFDYYKLYTNMDYKAADSPLNMRLVSSFIVYCMSKTGFFYDTAAQIDNYSFDKVVYFNAIFFNYVCVVLTCVLIFHLAVKQKHNVLLAFGGGLLYLLGFGTIFYELMPAVDAFSILLVAFFLYSYNKKSHWVLLPLLILILQREYGLIAIVFYTLIDFIKYRNRYFLQVTLYTLACFIIYIILRKSIFETARYAHHTNIEFMLNSGFSINFPLVPFVRQVAMTLNIFIIYALVVAYKYMKKIAFNSFEFLKINLLFLQLLGLTVLLSLGNNAGRYFYILTPFIIINLLNEIRHFKLETLVPEKESN